MNEHEREEAIGCGLLVALLVAALTGAFVSGIAAGGW